MENEKINELKSKIGQKMNEINHLNHQIDDIQLSEIIKHIKGKYIRFNCIVSPDELKGKVIYIPEDYPDPSIIKNDGEYECSLIIRCISFIGNITMRRDDTYFRYENEDIIRLEFRGQETIDRIINGTEILNKEKFLDRFKSRMMQIYNELEKQLIDD